MPKTVHMEDGIWIESLPGGGYWDDDPSTPGLEVLACWLDVVVYVLSPTHRRVSQAAKVNEVVDGLASIQLEFLHLLDKAVSTGNP
jgi:hypothetical protein